MIKSNVIRLCTAAGLFALLLLSLSYWWLENLPHELFGTAIFVLLAWHIYVNRFWFTKLFRGHYDTRRAFVVLLHVLLMVGMAILLVTSIVISKSLFAFLPLPDSVPLRDVHWFSAYWVMMIVGVHLGIHWVRVMAMTRTALGLSRDSVIRKWALRAVTLLLVSFGAWSLPVLDVWTKLTFNFSLNFWNFNQSVSPFFAHWLAVVAIPAAATHYLMFVIRPRRRDKSLISTGPVRHASHAEAINGA